MKKHKKEIKGRVNISISIPLTFYVDVENVEYEDEFGKPYYEEEYEYGVDEVINQSEYIKKLVHDNFSYIEEIKIEEY